MPEKPYTDEDLQAEAARQIKYTLDNVETDGLLEASTYDLGNGRRWEELPEGDWREALRSIDELVEGAADVSEWAVNLGADGLEPDSRALDAGERRVRVHLAFAPDISDDDRADLVGQFAAFMTYGLT
ncbi:hypothetical protein [Streptomyces anulatus]|uniref:hypothetical protein n=1 Tax=Streptomyces anulatus TaxID=1892 RepID=UPI003864BBE6|nr:hypothetical protein OG575_06065 [Streptomyces anulatus]